MPRQHADKRKQVLSKTIAELRETTETQLQKQKELEKYAAVTESEKQQIELSNKKLWAELLSSVAAAQAGVFAILVNKFRKIMKIFQQLDHLRSQWVLCQS